ncbi:MAG: cysteate synthase [Thermosynechococcaceae cyanobacterium]
MIDSVFEHFPHTAGEPKYIFRCLHCGATYPPDPFRLHCDRNHAPSLLRAVYASKQLTVKPDLPGLFRFIDWLPVEQYLTDVGKPITYQSTGLAQQLGLEQLWISFSGYWPERGGQLLTCSFKELEAITVLARTPKDNSKVLALSSAGNTGRAFAHIYSRYQIPLCLVIPENSLPAIWSTQDFSSKICLVVVNQSQDYFDAIQLGRLISKLDGFFPEGGAANIARRDGMGLTVLDAAVTLGQIPDHYVQAVGSGTGGIAAWEANLRLLEDGRFGNRTMRLHLAQNAPFTPMVNAWQASDPHIKEMTEADAKACISEASAKVLTNRQPAYSIAGGVFDALTASQGSMYAVTNAEALQARKLFADLEGIDISPASGVATAALQQAVQANKIQKTETVLLNITSGGFERLQQDRGLHYLQPSVGIDRKEISPNFVALQRDKFCPD